MAISRDPNRAAKASYELLIIGGGIYGVMLAREAARRGVACLLLEKEDFGGATSYNSLKTIHWGLRYLQTLNLTLFFRFVRERRWFLKQFPGLVEPLPVLMPLYGRGLQRPAVFRAAFLLDKILSPGRNRALPPASHLPFGKVIDAAEVREIFPGVVREGLRGGALWHDVGMPDSPRIVMEILRDACRRGARACNYMEAVDLATRDGLVTGVIARDGIDDRTWEFRAAAVINAAGPWSRSIAARFHADFPELFRSSLAWNVLFDREALSTAALALAPPRPGGHLYFVHPWKGRLLIGTGHAPRQAVGDRPQPTEAEMAAFLEELNAALPALQLCRADVLQVYAGYLPVTAEGGVQLTKAEAFIDHSQKGGPQGLYSLGGVKFTAARFVARKIISRLFPDRKMGQKNLAETEETIAPPAARGIFAYDWYPEETETAWLEPLQRIIEEESVQHLDDLMLRRTSLGDHPERAVKLAPKICQLFSWDARRQAREIDRLEAAFRSPEASVELNQEEYHAKTRTT